MRNCTRAFAVGVLAAGFSFTTGLLALNPPKEIFAPVERAFVPFGFDDNDNVEVILQGNFSDTCFRVGPVGYNVDKEKHLIKVWAKAYDYSHQEDNYCLDVLTPFLVKISIGILEEGSWDVEVPGGKVMQKFDIKRATTSSPDDYLYAPVTMAHINTTANGQQEVSIAGQFPKLGKGCMILQEVRQYRNPKDVLVVLPIAAIIDDARCEKAPLSFHEKFNIEAFHGIGLLHIRVSNGNSQNLLIDMP